MSYQRKVQRIGQSLFVSLPKPWVNKTKVNKNDFIRLIEQPDGSLSIFSKRIENLAEKTLIIDINETEQTLKRKIVGLYVDGFDIIKLQSKTYFTYDQNSMIRKTIESLFGLEIVESTSAKITLQCLLGDTASVVTMIQRIHSIIRSIFEETILVLNGELKDINANIAIRIHEVNRLSLVVHRLLRSSILFPNKHEFQTKPIDVMDFLRLLDKIIEVSKILGRITKCASSIKQTIPNDILHLLLEAMVQTMNMYDYSIRAIISESLFLASSVLDEKIETKFDNLSNALINLSEHISNHASIIFQISNISDNLLQIYTFSTEIAEITIDRVSEF